MITDRDPGDEQPEPRPTDAEVMAALREIAKIDTNDHLRRIRAREEWCARDRR